MSIASPDKVIEWNDAGIEGSFRALNRLYALLEKKHTDVCDKLTASKMHRAIRDVTSTIESFEYNKSVISLMEFSNYLQNLESVPVVALRNLVLLVSPFAPHIAEEMWNKTKNDAFVSLADWPAYDEKMIDEEAEALEKDVLSVIFDIRKVLEFAKIDKPKAIRLIVSPKWKYDFLAIVKKELEKTRDMKLIMAACFKEKELKQHGEEMAKIVPSVLKDPTKIPQMILSQEAELRNLEVTRKLIEKEFGAMVIIEDAESCKEEKKKSAMPSKPAIVVS
jgi:leucyl-tRNA synthetase